jgi:hypothetical protein
MQRQGHDEPSRTDHHSDGDDDDAPTRQHSTETELGRYEDDEVATAPWPPPS